MACLDTNNNLNNIGIKIHRKYISSTQLIHLIITPIKHN